MSLYEKLKDEEEILNEDLRLPERFPKIYIDQNDNIYCYIGVIDKERVLFGSSPFYLKDKKSEEAKKYIRGYFRIENGAIVANNIFLDEINCLSNDKKYKIIPGIIHFPQPNDMSFGIILNKYPELEDEITRKIFGLTYKETLDLVKCFNKLFKIYDTNSFYHKYPSITRSTTSDNYCDINDLWIPKEYPYIAFNESGYIYSHISLYSFYQHIQFITGYDINSLTSKKLIEEGLDSSILKNLFDIKEQLDFYSIPITKSYYFHSLDESQN